MEKTCLEIESAIASGDISHYKFDEKYIRQRNPEGKGGIDEQTKNAMLFDNLVVFNQARKMDNVTISVFEKMELGLNILLRAEQRLLRMAGRLAVSVPSQTGGRETGHVLHP